MNSPFSWAVRFEYAEFLIDFSENIDKDTESCQCISKAAVFAIRACSDFETVEWKDYTTYKNLPYALCRSVSVFSAWGEKASEKGRAGGDWKGKEGWAFLSPYFPQPKASIIFLNGD